MKREREEKSTTPSPLPTAETSFQRVIGRCPREFLTQLKHPIPANVGMHYAHSPSFLRSLTGDVHPHPIPPPGTVIPPEVISEYRKAAIPLHLPYYPPPPPIPPPFVVVPPFEVPQDNEQKPQEKVSAEDSSTKRLWPAMGFGIMDIREKNDCYIVALDLPGVSKEEIDVSLKHSSIVVECIRKDISDESGYKSYAERSFGKLIRTIQLPLKANPATISCKYQDGVLSIQLEKFSEVERNKKVRID